jgi:Histidine phosphatase superfamily (branch 1)
MTNTRLPVLVPSSVVTTFATLFLLLLTAVLPVCHAFQPSNLNHLQSSLSVSPLSSPRPAAPRVSTSRAVFDQKRSGYTTELGYDQFLRRRRLLLLERIQQRLLEREQRRKDTKEDGYEDIMMVGGKRRSPLRKLLKLPFRIVHRLFLQQPVEPGTLILIRHGESMWNANQTFTGWADPDLSERGWREAEHAAR